MNVVRSNFFSILPQLEEIIKESVLIAVDTEFTGLATSQEDRPSLFDSIEVRYEKIRRIVSNFSICQFGLSVFLNDSQRNHYTAHSFNFYLFPTTDERFYNPRFLIQCSNMEFLCEHKFDFNKWIYEGISYCNREEESLIMSTKLSKEEKEEMVGFRKVFQLLVDSKKPLMGHNMLLDLAYMLNSFHDALPSSYKEFKATVHSLFPTIIDTKNVCKSLRNKVDNYVRKTSLEELYNAFRSREYVKTVIFAPIIDHSEYSVKYSEAECFHEAGFDAFCVGFVFLKIAHLLAVNRLSNPRPIHFKQYLQTIDCYGNRVYLAQGPIDYIDFSGPDPKVREPECLRVRTVNGKKIKLDHLKGIVKTSAEFKLLTEDSVLMAIPGKSRLVSEVKESIEGHKSFYVVERVNYNNRGSIIKKAMPVIVLVSFVCIFIYKYNH